MNAHPTAEAIAALFRLPEHRITRPPITTISDADRWLERQIIHPNEPARVWGAREYRMRCAYRMLLVVWLRQERGVFCDG